jgi:starch synthase
MEKLLFVASEAYPLIKTGGLADVAGSLPEVLRQKGLDVRLLLPAYGDLLAGLEALPDTRAELELAGSQVRILETRLPGTPLITWLLDHPMFSERSGNPYLDHQGEPWPDNADRFMLLSRAAAAISAGDTALDWRPDVLHCNDWHTGPAIALTHLNELRPRTVFTIHNLAHMGIFDRETFDRLQLPEHFWQERGLEYYDQCSFIKGGLVFADVITTVSPTYAQEICHFPGGMGLEGLLSQRRDRLVGVLNGIDSSIWDPATDPCLDHPYDAGSLEKKALNKSGLQQALGLESAADRPLLGFVGRLVEQKGLELMLPILEQILAGPAQLVVLGTGDPAYEKRLQALADTHPDSMAVVLAYNESLAHRIEAAADIFLMPSLFEPCGLNQLYSLRYGTLPVVREVGGLADTVVDANAQTLEAGTATGFVFRQPLSGELLGAVQRAIALWHEAATWRQLQHNAMGQDFSWQQSADRYLELYRSATN